MYYTCLHVSCDPGFLEILMAEIAETGFDTFMETPTGFEAYVELEHYNAEAVDEIVNRYRDTTPVSYKTSRIEKQNWNEQWENSYHPIVVEDKFLIRASFHKADPRFPLEVIITPKMSFGTGHHQTTYLMVKHQMQIDHKNKRVMDAGCGTAILSIVASKLGAREVEAFDIDEWSITNGNENIEVNGVKDVRIQLGKISEVGLSGKFDIVLANINKNILLAEIERYQSFLSPGGYLLLSGFYIQDVQDLLVEGSKFGLKEITHSDRENWAALLLQKA
jgi:ribosomal protein L11 methyltransferase